jgi:SAM-dependent methyltransferase
VPDVGLAFGKAKHYWVQAAVKRGMNYVSRVKQDPTQQQRQIEALLMRALTGDSFYRDGMDFGCGPGRFLPLLAKYCGHLWAVDILESSLQPAAAKAPNVTPHLLEWPLNLQLPSLDFLWSSLVLQHLVDEDLFTAITDELRRLLKPGARVLILDNALDRAPHVRSRPAERLAASLGLRAGWKADKVTIDQRPQDHWFIDGHRA